jgi:hypothetical protein
MSSCCMVMIGCVYKGQRSVPKRLFSSNPDHELLVTHHHLCTVRDNQELERNLVLFGRCDGATAAAGSTHNMQCEHKWQITDSDASCS